MYTYHKDGTQPARPEIFVFGSNLDGRHGKGAAKHARDKLGAETGVAEGMTGRCYALPTVGHNLNRMSLEDIQKHVSKFLAFARKHDSKDFFMTRVGCVLAGYSDAQIAPMFRDAPDNINFPIDWKPYLEEQ